jgi:hypothetical protein
MAIGSNRFPLQNAIKKILDDPNSRPALPDSSGDGTSVGDGNFGKGDLYDTGMSPDIALNNGNVVVEVHQSQAANTLWYHVGKVEGKKITWGGSIKYDNGVLPSVAINNDGLVVEVHKSQSHDTLWCHVGKVEGDKINWGGSVEYDDGVQPSVAITNDGLVVEVHKSQSHDTLWYRVGKVEGDKINWGGSVKYDDGVQPSVAITNDGLVVEVHKSQSYDTLWYRGTGQANGNTITWHNDKSQNYSNGTVPKVACNAQLAVETHYYNDDEIDAPPSSKNRLEYSVLTLPAFRSNWIELHGDNSYCYCMCNSSSNNKQRHASDKTMNIKEGAPYLYAVFTKDDDTVDFPTDAVLTIEGPDGTKYNRDIEEENQLVIMSGSSVRCLVIKDPKPGDWKMTMTVPEGVGFHCECNTVPSKDVYSTITNVLSKRDLPIGKRDSDDGIGWIGAALTGLVVASASIVLGGMPIIVGGLLGSVSALGTKWLFGKKDPVKQTSKYMEFTARLRPLVEKLVTDIKEKGFIEASKFYYELIGKNLSLEEWKVILSSQPHNTVSIVMVYAEVFKVIEHMTDAEEQNAVRHVLWQCLLKKRFGAELATKLGEAHEIARPGSDADNKADEINNEKGQKLADEVLSAPECFQRAREMWAAGELQTRPDLEGDPT